MSCSPRLPYRAPLAVAAFCAGLTAGVDLHAQNVMRPERFTAGVSLVRVFGETAEAYTDGGRVEATVRVPVFQSPLVLGVELSQTTLRPQSGIPLDVNGSRLQNYNTLAPLFDRTLVQLLGEWTLSATSTRRSYLVGGGGRDFQDGLDRLAWTLGLGTTTHTSLGLRASFEARLQRFPSFYTWAQDAQCQSGGPPFPRSVCFGLPMTTALLSVRLGF